MVPVLSLLVDPLDQRVSGGIQMSIHGCAVGKASVCHSGHTCDGVLAIGTRHIVMVEVVMRHAE